MKSSAALVTKGPTVLEPSAVMTSPPSPEPYSGDGSFLTLQVADARTEHERLVAGGVELALELTDEPWGQRRFGVLDPAGMWVDVVEQIEPAPGWWDPYVSG